MLDCKELKWINYDLVEEEVGGGDGEYTLLTRVRELKDELAEELSLEREECAKALEKAQEWMKDRLRK